MYFGGGGILVRAGDGLESMEIGVWDLARGLGTTSLGSPSDESVRVEGVDERLGGP